MELTRQNWVLVDYENVQNIELDLVAGMPVHVILFIGQQQKSVPTTLLTRGFAIKEQVTVIESAGMGKNAMDFQIAFQAGRITEAHPEAYVHFVSKDKGFEVLVKHMALMWRVMFCGVVWKSSAISAWLSQTVSPSIRRSSRVLSPAKEPRAVGVMNC